MSNFEPDMRVNGKGMGREEGFGSLSKAGAVGCLVVGAWFIGARHGTPEGSPLPEAVESNRRGTERRDRPVERVAGAFGTREEMAREMRANPKGLDFYLKRWQEEMGAPDPKFGSVAASMALEGYAKEALQLATETVGPGMIRCQIIRAIFRAADPEESAPLFGLLEYGDEKEAACEGLSQVLAFIEAPATLDLGAFGYLGEWRDRFLGGFAVKHVLQQRRTSDEAGSEALRSVFELPLSQEAARRVLMELGDLLPFESWDHLDRAGSTLSGTERHRIMGRMLGVDAARAMELIAAADGREADMMPAFKRWLQLDAAKPIEWLQSQSAHLSVAQKDHATQGIAEFSASQGDCDVAWQWVGQISDVALRKKAEGQVWSMERDIVRRMVHKEPESALRSLIGGESQHQDYWLEEAMTTWLSKDPGQAVAWREANWNTIPAAQSQYLAAAFAKQALAEQDVGTALRWAGLVQDPKTKTRLNEVIAEAGGK
jgi:hypothetical protein